MYNYICIYILSLAVNSTNSPQNITYSHLVETLSSVAFHGATVSKR